MTHEDAPKWEIWVSEDGAVFEGITSSASLEPHQYQDWHVIAKEAGYWRQRYPYVHVRSAERHGS